MLETASKANNLRVPNADFFRSRTVTLKDSIIKIINYVIFLIRLSKKNFVITMDYREPYDFKSAVKG